MHTHTSEAARTAEDFCTAPWCAETLIGLAGSRHTPGLFECTGDDDIDYEGAEKLDGLRRSLGLDPTQFWRICDQHIMAMMDKASETWFATARTGGNLRFNLTHVASHWKAVDQTLSKKPWWPLDTVPYYGPPHDAVIFEERPRRRGPDENLFENEVPRAPRASPRETFEIETIIEGSLGDPGDYIEEQKAAQGGSDSPGETEQPMYPLPPSVDQWPPPQILHGMDQAEYDALCREIWQRYPTLPLEAKSFPDGSIACGIEYKPGIFMRVRNAAQWRGRRHSNIERAVKQAVAYGRSLQGLHGMSQLERSVLEAVILQRYPALSLGAMQFDDGSYGLGIEYAEGKWSEPIRCEAEWDSPPLHIQKILVEALRYGESRRANAL